MHALLIQLAIQTATLAMKSMMANGLAGEIQQLVVAAFDSNGTGEEKRQKVLAELVDIGGLAGQAVAETAPWMVHAVIELAVGQHKTGKSSD